MSGDTLDRILGNHSRRYVPPVTDTEVGREVYWAGREISTCRNERQRAGWQSAAQDGRRIIEAEWMAADIEAA